MKTKLLKNETLLSGKWVVVNKQVIGDEACQRVKYLTSEVLEKIATTGGGWEILYRDNSDGRYWELFYEQGDWHGGGPPSLKNISEEEAKEKYQLGISFKM
jgi:Immunity protein 27